MSPNLLFSVSKSSNQEARQKLSARDPLKFKRTCELERVTVCAAEQASEFMER